MLKPNFAGGWFWRVWKLKIGHYWLSNSGGLGSFAEKSCLLNKVRTGGVNVKLESLDIGYWVYEVTSGDNSCLWGGLQKRGEFQSAGGK